MPEEIPTLRDAEEAYEEGDLETALAICEGLIGEDEESADIEVLFLAGECLMEMQETAEAEHLFDLCLRSEPNNPLLLGAKGIAAFDRGRLDEAQDWLTKAADLEDAMGEPLFYLGMIAEFRGDRDRAEALYAAAVERDPENFAQPKDWSEEAVRTALDEMIAELPDPLGAWLAALPMEVRDLPSPKQLVRDGEPVSPLVHCLFLGTPSPGAEGDDPEQWLTAAPDQVVVFRRNLGKSAHDEYELQSEVFEAVMWELMEFLGLEDSHLVELGVLEADDDEDLTPHHED